MLVEVSLKNLNGLVDVISELFRLVIVLDGWKAESAPVLLGEDMEVGVRFVASGCQSLVYFVFLVDLKVLALELVDCG